MIQTMQKMRKRGEKYGDISSINEYDNCLPFVVEPLKILNSLNSASMSKCGAVKREY